MHGWIGNQLFQFFAAYSYAKKFNRDLIVNIDKYAEGGVSGAVM
jgi:hypothetical protein